MVAAATYLERELTRLMGVARKQTWSRQEWRDSQRPSLARLTDKYETIARGKLRRRQLQEGLSFYDAGTKGVI